MPVGLVQLAAKGFLEVTLYSARLHLLAAGAAAETMDLETQQLRERQEALAAAVVRQVALVH